MTTLTESETPMLTSKGILKTTQHTRTRGKLFAIRSHGSRCLRSKFCRSTMTPFAPCASQMGPVNAVFERSVERELSAPQQGAPERCPRMPFESPGHLDRLVRSPVRE